MLYISTDYVFDGSNPPNDVSDETNPLNFYGKSKLDGEKVVLETDPSKINFNFNLVFEVFFN
jgi:dTDP-4-dehydrorhamnose reductase